jgi:hypothetical protein
VIQRQLDNLMSSQTGNTLQIIASQQKYAAQLEAFLNGKLGPGGGLVTKDALAASFINAASHLTAAAGNAPTADFESTFVSPAAGTGVTAAAAGSGTVQQSTRQEPVAVSLHLKHASVTSMYDEYHGLGLFSAFPGGLLALENSQGNKWRSHFTVAQKMHFSRLKRVVQAVHTRLRNAEDRDLAGVLAEFDAIMKGPGVGTLSNLADKLQDDGYIPRNKRAKSSES